MLEREVGARLIERSPTGARLTSAGALVYERAKTILSHLDQLAEAARRAEAAQAQPVRVGFAPSMMNSLGVGLIEQVCEGAEPTIKLQVLEEAPPQLDGMLASGQVDIVVGPRRSAGEDIASEPLFLEPLVLIYPRAWGELDGRDLNLLAGLPWVATRRAHSVRALIESAFAQVGSGYRLIAEIDSPHTVVRVVQRGIGVTALPRAAAEQAAADGLVAVTAFGPEPILRPIFLNWRNQPEPTPAGRRALELLRSAGAELGRRMASA